MGKRRSPSQIARDKTKIADLYLNGYDQNQIASELSIPQSTVSESLREYHADWIEKGYADVGERRTELELKLRHIYQKSLAAFEAKSYPGHLRNALMCLQSISKLHGLDKDVLELNAKVGINSVAFHQAISESDLRQAAKELEDWRKDLPEGHRPPSEADNSHKGMSGQDSEVRRLTSHSEASEYSEASELNPAEIEPDFEVTDPNNPNFPLTL